MSEILGFIAQAGIPVLILVIAALLVFVKEIGFRVGTRRRLGMGGDVGGEGAGVIVGGLLALTAFVLALTLSAATERLTERRAGSLNEANAIGTAWLRAAAVEDAGPRLAALIRDYAQARLDFVSAERFSPAIDVATAQTDAVSAEIWSEVAALVAGRQDAVASQVMVAVNDMFDATAATRYALESGLPEATVRLMMVMTIGAMFAVGWQLGLMARPNYLLAALLGLFWSAVIVTVLDMGTPRIGRFEIETAPYVWTLSSMGGAATPAKG